MFDHFVGLALKGLKIVAFPADKFFIKVGNKTMQGNKINKNTAMDKFKVNNEDPTKSLKLTGCVYCISIFTVFNAELKNHQNYFLMILVDSPLPVPITDEEKKLT